MMKILKTLLIIISIISFSKSTLTAPNGLSWVEFSSSNEITVQGDSFSDALTYDFKYIKSDGTENILEDQTSSSANIPCTAKNGEKIIISYRYKTSGDISEYSNPISFFCADVPGKINTFTNLLADTSKIILTWEPPDDNGGSPILGYYIKMRETGESSFSVVYDGSNYLTTTTTISSYNNNNLQLTTYHFQIFAINIIAALFKTDFTDDENNSPLLSIVLQNIPHYSYCILSGDGLSSFTWSDEDKSIYIQAYDSSNTIMTSGGGIFMYDIRDYCTINSLNAYSLCERLTDTTDTHYNENIFSSESDYMSGIFTDNNDGTYTAKYNLIANGWITLRIFQLFSGGLRGQYYDNVWFMEPPTLTEIDNTINFNWGTNYIFNSLSDFLSIRWIGAILSPETALFTFTVSADDGSRIIINNEVVLDHINSCCDDCTFTYNLVQGNYYNLIIEYVQKQGEARMKLYWESESIPKQIIPEGYLFYYEYLPNSPYSVEITSNLISFKNCYIENLDSKLYVGKKTSFNIIPVDIQGNVMTTDETAFQSLYFSISLINSDSSITNGNIYTQSTYDSTKVKFTGSFVPLIPGTYNLIVSNGGEYIKNNPIELTVLFGDVSEVYSTISNLDTSDKTAGLTFNFQINLYDVMNNKYSTEPTIDPDITLIANCLNSNNYQSPLNIIDPNLNLADNYAGNAESNSDGTYKLSMTILKAGTYEMYIYINKKKITNTPYSVEVIPTLIDADKCLSETLSSNIVNSGNTIIIKYQCRDMYGNNIKSLLTTMNENSAKIISLSDTSYSESGTLSDISGMEGCYEGSFTPIKSGTYNITITINNILIPQIKIVVNPSNADYTKSIVIITNLKSSYVVGEYIQFQIISYDINDNLVDTDTTSEYKIIPLGTDPSNTFNNIEYTAQSLGNGIFTYKLQITYIDTYTFNVKLNNNDIVNSPFSNIKFTPDIASDYSIISTYISNDIVAGSTNNIYKVKLYDQYNNLITDQGNETIVLDFINTHNTSITYSFIGKYNYDSINYENYLFNSITIDKIGTYSISLKITNNFGLIGYYYQNVDFHNLLSKKSLNYHPTLYSKYYTRIDETIDFNLGYSSFMDNYPSKLISVVWEGYLKPDSSEIYTITFEVQGRILVYINNILAISYSDTKNSATSSTDTKNYVNIALDSSVYTPIKILYIKDEDVLITVIKMYWESDTIDKQIIPKYNLYSDLYNVDEKTLTVINADTSPNTLTILSDNYNEQCSLNGVSTFTFQIYDLYDNIQTLNQDTITAYFQSVIDSTLKYTCSISYDSSNYIYTVSYTITSSGEYNLFISILVNGVGSENILSSFKTFSCLSESSSVTIDTSKTVVSGDGLHTAIAGEDSYIYLQLYDSLNNKISASINNLNIQSSISSNDETVSNENIYYDSSLEKYVIKYIAYSTTSEYNIVIRVSNTQVYSDTMTLKNNIPSNIKSVYSGLSSSISVNFDSSNSFNIILKDSYSNLVVDQRYNIYSVIDGNFDKVKGVVTEDINDLSLYSVTYSISALNDTYSGCGIGKINSYALKNGIKEFIYNNYYLSGNYNVSLTTNEVSLSLEEDDLLLGLYDKLYKSIQFNFYFKASYNEDYTFILDTNKNNIRLFIDDVLVINSFDSELTTQYSYTKKLVANTFYNFRLNIYIAESLVSILLSYYSTTEQVTSMNSNNGNVFYDIGEGVSIENKQVNILTYSPPSKITTFYESTSSYSQTNVTFNWEAPSDNGCSEITNYKIKKYDSSTSSYIDLKTVSNTIFTYTDSSSSITAGNEYQYKILAINAIGDGKESDALSCYTITLSTQPLNLDINTYDEEKIKISWDVPSDTGTGDSSYPIKSYYLEYKDSTISNNEYTEIYSGTDTSFLYNVKTNKLIYGHTYYFKISCSTQRGNSTLYTEKAYLYSSTPSKPLSPPIIDSSNTNKNQISFSYFPVTSSNGAAITKYNIYINGDTTPIDNGLNLQYTYTSVTEGDGYSFQYSAVNSNGEGPKSDLSLRMLAAVLPSAPQNLMKDSSNLVKGYISIIWDAPNDNGGLEILGYKIYLNNILNTIVQSNVLSYNFSNYINPYISNTISVSAYTILGEGDKITINDIYSTSIPGKITSITLVSVSSSQISIKWNSPSDNGGSSITSYDVRKNDGSEFGQNYDTEIQVTDNSYTFSSLSISTYYSIQVRANNINGNGEWSNYVTYYTADAPDDVTNFKIDKSKTNTTQIFLTWDIPTNNGGCEIYGYKIYLSDGTLLYNGSYPYYIFNYAKNIISSTYYTFKIYSYNCQYDSTTGVTVSGYSAKVPDKMNPLVIYEYTSTTSVIVSIDNSVYDGGMPIKYYNIYKDQTKLSPSYDISSVARNNKITIDSLTLGTEYHLSISAENIIGEGEVSEEIKFTFANPPSIPQNVEISKNGNYFYITWSAPSSNNGDDSIGYKIYLSYYIDKTKLNYYNLIYDTEKQNGIYKYKFVNETKISILEGRLYYVYIVSYNSAGESNKVFSQFKYGKLPTIPYNLKVNDISISNNYIKIQFKNDLSGNILPITKYSLHKNYLPSSTVNDNEYTISSITYDSDGHFIISDTDSISSYSIGDKVTYKLKSINEIGESDYSSLLTVTLSSLPNPPLNLAINERINKTSISIKWDSDTIITNNIPTLGYVIYIYFNSIIEDTITTTGVEYTLRNLIPGRKYEIYLKSMNALGESESSSNTIQFYAGTIPSKVLNVKRDENKLSKTSISILFDPPEDNGGNSILYYYIYKADDNSLLKTIDTSTITSDLGETFSSLTAGEKLNLIIIPENIIGKYENEEIYSFVCGTYPTEPSALSLKKINVINSNGNKCNVYISWSAPSDNGGTSIIKYTLYISSDGIQYDPHNLNIPTYSISSYLITNLNLGSTYYVKIMAYNIIGASDEYIDNFIPSSVPSKPLNLAVSSTDTQIINLEWDKPLNNYGSSITTYKVYYMDITSSSSSIQSVETNSVITSYQLNSLTADIQYKIYITAVSSNGESPKSNSIISYSSAVPKNLQKPNLITGTRTSNSFQITFDTTSIISSLPILGYDVLVKDLNTENSDYITVYDGKYINNVNTVTISNLKNGHYYNIIYYAYNKAGKSDKSEILKLLCGSVPSPPSNLLLTSVSSTNIEISWSFTDSNNEGSNIQITGFYIYNNGVLLNNNLLSSDTLTYSISNSQVGTTYVITLTAKNEIGESSHSDSLSIVAVDLPNPPILSLTKKDTNYCMLSWTSVTAPTGSTISKYILYNDENIIYQGALLTYTHSSLEINKSYYYTIVSVNEAGSSTESNQIECLTNPISNSPGAITLISSSNTNIKVKWTPPSITYSSIAYYNLYMREYNSGNDFTVIYTGSDLQYDVTSGITELKQYEFKVSDVDAEDRESDYSNIAIFYAASVPTTISDSSITLENYSKNQIKISWTYTSTGNELTLFYYILYIEGNDYKKKIYVADKTYYIVSGLTYGETYSININSVNAVGESDNSTSKSITVIYNPDPPSNMKITSIIENASDNTYCDINLSWEISNKDSEPNMSITGYSISAFLVNSDNSIDTNEISLYDTNSNTNTYCTVTGKLLKGKSYLMKFYSYNTLKSLTYSSLTSLISLKPEKITYVQILSRSTNSIELQWDIPNSDTSILYYKIYLLNGTELYTYINRYIFEDLTTGSSFSVQLSSTNYIGESDISESFSYTIYGLPSSPINIYLDSYSKSNIKIKFNPSNNDGGNTITKYNIYRGIDNTLSSFTKIDTLTNSIDSSLLEYDDTNVLSCVNYYYTITSENSYGESELSLDYYINVKTQSSPENYNSETPTVSKIGDNSLLIKWNEISSSNNGGCSDDIKYKLYMSKSDDSSFNLIYDGIELFYSVSNLNNYEYYYFKVIVYNSIGESESSISTKILTGSLPSSPSNLKLVYRKDRLLNGNGETSIKVKWDLMSDSILGYNVYFSTDGSSYDNVNQCKELSSTINYCELTSTSNSISEGNYYYIVVTSYNIIGESDYSNILKIIAGEIPLKPTEDLTINTYPKLNLINIQIPSSAITSSIYGSINPSKYYIKMNDNIISSSISTVVNIDGLTIGSTYTFKYALSNIIFDKNNLNNEDLNYGNEISVFLTELPDQVTNVQFDSTTLNTIYPDKVKITWNPLSTNTNLPLLKYIITITDITNSNSESEIEISPILSSYLITSLTPGNKYSFKIKGTNQIGNGKESDSISMISGIKPIEMNSPIISSYTKSSVSLTWTLPSNLNSGGTTSTGLTISNFKLYMNSILILTTSDSSTLSYTISNLNTGNTYIFQLSCTNIFGDSPLSDETTLTLATYPSAPINFIINSQSSTSISLSWDKPTFNGGNPIIKYELMIYNSDKSSIILTESELTTTSYTFINSITAGNTYIFTLRAINQFTINNPDTTKYIWSSDLIGYAYDNPSKIENIYIQNVEKYSGDIYWTGLSTTEEFGYDSSVNYNLEVSYGSVDYYLIYSGISNTYSFSVPVYDETYSFRLRVNNRIGYSDYSNILTIKFNSIPEQMSPPTLDELNSDSRNNKIPYIKVSWTNSNNDISITGYKLEMRLSTDSDTEINTIYEDTNINTLSYTIYQDNNNIIVGNTYYFYISCKNEIGYSIRSEKLSVLFATVPDALTILTYDSNSITKTSVTLSWSISNIFNGGSEIQGYILQNKLSTDTSYSNSKTISGMSTLTYTFSSLSTGLTYNFRIAAFNTISDISLLNFSNEISVLIATVPGKITTFEQDFTNLVKNQVTIKWKAPSDNGGLAIISYKIKRETTIGSNTYILITSIISSTNTFSYSDTSPTSPTQKYKILCNNNVGDSEESDELDTYVGIKPGKVTGLSATSISSTSITFKYEAPDNVNDLNNPIDHYYIISSSPTSSYTDNPYDNSLLLSYTLNSISSTTGSSFKFKVFAHNNLGYGDYSDEITILNCDSPNTPIITVNSRTADSITFSFSPHADDITDTSCQIQTFEFYRESSLIFSGANHILSYTDSGLTNGVTYSYTLKYYNIVKNSGSVTESYIIGAIPNKPKSITIDSVDKDGNLKISWTNDNGDNSNVEITSNTILIALASDDYDESNKITVTDMTSLSHTWNDRTTGSEYKIKISATNSIGESDYSSEIKVKIASPPDQVSSLTISSLSSSSITISYTIPSTDNGDSITGYNIYLDNSLLDTVTKLTYTYSSLNKSTQYKMSVSAINSIGESSLTSITFYACDVPSKPGIPTLISSTSNTINFKWNYPTDNGGCTILEYEIYYRNSDDNDFVSLATITNIYNLEYSHTISNPSTNNFLYKVRAKNNVGYSEFGETATLSLSS